MTSKVSLVGMGMTTAHTAWSSGKSQSKSPFLTYWLPHTTRAKVKRACSSRRPRSTAWKGHGIRASGRCRGVAEAPTVAGALVQLASEEDEKARTAKLIKHTPQGRFSSLMEIAEAILFLATEKSSCMTSAAQAINGDHTAC